MSDFTSPDLGAIGQRMRQPGPHPFLSLCQRNNRCSFGRLTARAVREVTDRDAAWFRRHPGASAYLRPITLAEVAET